MTNLDLHPGELPPDAVLRVDKTAFSNVRAAQFADRLASASRARVPIFVAGEYWQVSRLGVDGDDLVIGLRLLPAAHRACP